jgi:hypothetical protein
MSLRLLVCSFVLGASVVCADPSAEEEAFLRVPGSIRPAYNPDKNFRVADLPAGMREVLRAYDWRAPDGALPAKLHGFTFDLNQDGNLEYFIATIYGGSGGPDYMILTESETGWSVIGGFQGALHVKPTSASWPDLVTTSRGGGGIWAKTHHVFRGGKYVSVLIEHYQRGVITIESIPQ